MIFVVLSLLKLITVLGVKDFQLFEPRRKKICLRGQIKLEPACSILRTRVLEFRINRTDVIYSATDYKCFDKRCRCAAFLPFFYLHDCGKSNFFIAMLISHN